MTENWDGSGVLAFDDFWVTLHTVFRDLFGCWRYLHPLNYSYTQKLHDRDLVMARTRTQESLHRNPSLNVSTPRPAKPARRRMINCSKLALDLIIQKCTFPTSPNQRPSLTSVRPSPAHFLPLLPTPLTCSGRQIKYLE